MPARLEKRWKKKNPSPKDDHAGPRSHRLMIHKVSNRMRPGRVEGGRRKEEGGERREERGERWGGSHECHVQVGWSFFPGLGAAQAPCPAPQCPVPRITSRLTKPRIFNFHVFYERQHRNINTRYAGMQVSSLCSASGRPRRPTPSYFSRDRRLQSSVPTSTPSTLHRPSQAKIKIKRSRCLASIVPR